MSRAGLTSGWRIGRIFGITVRVHPGWIIICLLLVYSLGDWLLPASDVAGGGSWWEGERLLAQMRMGLGPQVAPDWPRWQHWALALVGTLGLFGCVLAHELAHSVVAIASGMKVEGITLFIFGGVARLRDEAPTAGAEFRVAVVGPAMSLALAAFCWALYYGFGWLLPEQSRALLFYFGFVNTMLAAFNLLPGFPMDGGRLLRAAIWKRVGNLRQATYIASLLGRIVGGTFMALGGTIMVLGLLAGGGFSIGALWLAFIGFFLWNAAKASYQHVVLREAFAGLTVGHLMRRETAWIGPDVTLDLLVSDCFHGLHPAGCPVVEDGRIIGKVGLGEVRSIARPLWPHTRVRDAMRHGADCVTALRPTDDALDGLRMMVEDDRGAVVVAEDGCPQGVLRRDDLLALMEVRSRLGPRAGAEPA